MSVSSSVMLSDICGPHVSTVSTIEKVSTFLLRVKILLRRSQYNVTK